MCVYVIFAGIVAGGLGLRMGTTEIPKQFMELSGKPIIIHTIEKFLFCSFFDYICIGVHKNWKFHLKDILKKFNLDDEKILLTDGGKDRNCTIINIVNFLEELISNSKNDEESIIVTHDAVRPFVTFRIIKDNIDAVKRIGACNTVIESFDTVIKSNREKTMIEEIPRRDFMFLGQTPQSFNMRKLKEFYLNLKEEQKSKLTDACKIFSLNNHPIEMVLGETFNIKITNTNDFKIAQALVETVN